MFHRILIFLALNTASLFVVDKLLVGLSVTGGALGYVLIGIVIGLLNLIVKPFLNLVSLPIIFLTGGLFSMVINALILWLSQEIIEIMAISTITFAITGTVTYIVAVIVFGILNSVFHKVLPS
jgi:putative membrane protein